MENITSKPSHCWQTRVMLPQGISSTMRKRRAGY